MYKKCLNYQLCSFQIRTNEVQFVGTICKKKMEKERERYLNILGKDFSSFFIGKCIFLGVVTIFSSWKGQFKIDFCICMFLYMSYLWMYCKQIAIKILLIHKINTNVLDIKTKYRKYDKECLDRKWQCWTWLKLTCK